MTFQPPKGTRDFLPEEMEKWQTVLDVVRQVYEKYGFRPLDTPAFESFELLAAKGGAGEAIKDEIYYFKDKSDRELGLRFDLTVPMSRVLANNPNLPKPFKRYQIGKVWRYGNPQAMRYREFWQADVDTVGSASPLADAECVAAVCEVFEKLGFKEIRVRLNNRKLIQSLMEDAGITGEKLIDTFRIVDKMDKIGEEGVCKELEEKGVEWRKVSEIIEVRGAGALEKAEKKWGGTDGLDELKQFVKFGRALGMEKLIEVDFSLMRGLDYYTGLVFEIMVGEEKLTFAGGGRYDNMIKKFGGPELPATGISIGLNRIVALMEERNMFKGSEAKKVFVAYVSDEMAEKALETCQMLRKAGITALMDVGARKLGKQMEYAAAAGVSCVVIMGPKELEKKSVKLRDMKTGKEKDVKMDRLVEEF